MLTISTAKPASTRGRYYFNYYTREAEGHSFWYGKGADIFKLSGPVRERPFVNMLNGLSPDGRIGFFKNSGDPNRNAFWDLTFSVPKDLSVVWMADPQGVGERIDRAVNRALLRTLDRVQDKYGLSRTGAGGKEWVPAKLVFAVFRHISSRELQPQLHPHVLLFNIGIREDATIGTLQTKPLFDAKIELGTFFRHELAKELTKDLGFKIQHNESGFRIEGVPLEVSDHFSKRRHQIVDYMRAHEMSGGKDAKIAAVKTRAPKRRTPQDTLVIAWQKEAEALGFSKDGAEKLVRKPELKVVKKPQNVIDLHPRRPRSRDDLFSMWCKKVEQGDCIDQSDQDELGVVVSKDIKNPLSPTVGERSRVVSNAWRQFQKELRTGFDDCLRGRMEMRRVELKSHLRTHMRVVSGGAQNSRGKDNSTNLEKEPRAKLTRIRLKDQKTIEKEFWAKYPHLKPGATRAGRRAESKANPAGNDSKSDESEGAFKGEKADDHRNAKQSPKNDSAALKAFKRALRKATDRIFPEKQTRERITKMAFAIGARFGIEAKEILKAVDELKLPILGKFYRVEWRPLFPNAPWDRARNFRLPRIVLFKTPRKWGQIYYSKPIWRIGTPSMEFRVQQRMLFPKAPWWNPFSKASLPALRFAPYRPHAAEAKLRQQAKKEKTLSL